MRASLGRTFNFTQVSENAHMARQGACDINFHSKKGVLSFNNTDIIAVAGIAIIALGPHPLVRASLGGIDCIGFFLEVQRILSSDFSRGSLKI